LCVRIIPVPELAKHTNESTVGSMMVRGEKLGGMSYLLSELDFTKTLRQELHPKREVE
jgi:hypothetical protein